MRSVSLFGLIFLAHGVAAFLVTLLKKRRQKYDGLDSVVSFSSRLIAASRAVETDEVNALVRDPLAVLLAGKQALARATDRAKEAPAGRGRSKLIGLMAIRTRWFDDQILAALGVPISSAVPSNLQSPQSQLHLPAPLLLPSPRAAAAHSSQQAQREQQAEGHPSSSSSSSSGQAAVSTGQAQQPLHYVVGPRLDSKHIPRQVVLLGAGMDSRPWRLNLPAEVRWFEVDRHDVLQAKQQMLVSCGAEVPAASPSSDTPSSMAGHAAGQHASPAVGASSSSTGRGASNGSRNGELGGGNSCTGVGSPSPRITFPLRAASWEGVPCDLCAAGWTRRLAAAGFDPRLPTLWVAEGLLMYLAPSEVASLLMEMAGASAPGSMLVTVSVTEAVIEGIQQRGSGSELLGTWKFGCPADPAQFFKDLGWRQDLALTRSQMAASLNIDPQLCAFQREDSSAPRSLFIVASVLGANWQSAEIA